MTVCRHAGRWAWPLAVLLPLVALLLVPARGGAAESPVGKLVSDIVPLNNRVRKPEHILGVMQARPGRAYDEAQIQEDVRRLHATKWFVPGGVQVHTRPDGGGGVVVFVTVTEVTNTVREVLYPGAEHIRDTDLQQLTGVRKGDAMNPLHNEQGRGNILKKLQEDGHYFASVELAEGGKVDDTRVVYQIVEGPVVKVAGVEFKGANAASTGRLKTQLATKRVMLGMLGGKFNPMSLDLDRQKLTEYYHGLGYLRAQIFPEVVTNPDPRTVTIVYHIEEGVPHSVGSVDAVGAKSVPNEKLAALAGLKPGERYDGRKVAGDSEQMKAYIGMRGVRSNVEPLVYDDPARPGVVNVHYQVQGDGGRPDRVGQIKIEGNDVTQDRVILNQLDLRPGQVLQYPLLEDARMRLARLGIFDGEEPPAVDVIENEFDSEFKDLRVKVKETRTGQFMVGAGVNSNSGLNGSIVINERNFDITRFPTSWDDFRYGRAFRGAGQEFRVEAVPGTEFQRYSATFREPYLFDSRFGFTNSAYFFTRQYNEYSESRVGMRTTVDRRLDPIWKANLSNRIEKVGVKDVLNFAPQSIREDAGDSFINGIRAGLTRDTRDSYVYPTRGNVLDVGVEQVLGDYTFPIGTAEVTQFFSSRYFQREDGSGKHVVAVRSQLGIEGSNAPVFERFYAGGFRSLRGFSFRGVGPKENGFFTGGTFSFLNTVEYQIPVLPSDKLYFVSFLDHGTVNTDVSLRDYRVSAGFGLRVAVPALGPLPLAFDFAFPIRKAPGDDKQVFSFYVGLFGGQNQ